MLSVRLDLLPGSPGFTLLMNLVVEGSFRTWSARTFTKQLFISTSQTQVSMCVQSSVEVFTYDPLWVHDLFRTFQHKKNRRCHHRGGLLYSHTGCPLWRCTASPVPEQLMEPRDGNRCLKSGVWLF